MRIVFIIAEFDPFHKGHAYLLGQVRERFPQCAVAAIMSGNFTERGEPASIERFTRARAAVMSGVNLVISLPFPWCASSSEYFARAGVAVAKGIAAAYPNEEHILAFGSECGDVNKIRKVSGRVGSGEFASEAVRLGHSYHGARGIEALYRELYGDDGAELLSSPNDTLAVEYIKAISALSAHITPYAVKREGAEHNGEAPRGDFASASYIRGLFLSGRTDEAIRFMPQKSAEATLEFIRRYGAASPERTGDAMMLSLRTADGKNAEKIAECAGGVGRRVIDAARASGTYRDMAARAATKQYTNARLRRAALFAALGVESFHGTLPTYTETLAADGLGRSVLHDSARRGGIEILTKGADFGKMTPASAGSYLCEAQAERLYTLAFSPALPSDEFLKISPFMRHE